LCSARSRVVAGPLAASVDPAYRVTVDVQRFESVPGETVSLEAVWLLRRPGAAATSGGRSALREAVQGEGYEALAAAHSRALAGIESRHRRRHSRRGGPQRRAMIGGGQPTSPGLA
jgi:uncharacterized lipoprotein YmbA